jgi:alanine racemase
VTSRPPIAERLTAARLPPLPRTAWAEIDLDALRSNLEAIAAALPDGVRIQPVVKADAYGHGAVPIARALLAAGAHAVCVATVDEALELRDAAIEAPILVLFPIPPAMARRAADADITVSVGDPVLLERMLDQLEEAPPDRPLAVAVEVETGLGRCGFRPIDVGPALARIDASQNVVLSSVWSHMTAAEERARTSAQVASFAEATAGLGDGSGAGAARHLAASAGILAGTVPAFDAVRPGLIVYGILPEESVAAGPPAGLASALRPVVSIHASPVRVVELPAGSGIGYGPAFTTSRPSRIATLPLGYADGYARTMSGRVSALVRGRRAPIVGTIAMDALMADVTDIPGDPVTIDDEFCLLGRQGHESIDVYELARARTTISWEVVAAMAARLPRVYTRSSGPVSVRTLTEGRSPWRSSSSGTATSATSRSTPS